MLKKQKKIITCPFIVHTYPKKKGVSRVGKPRGFLPSSNSAEAPMYSAGDIFIYYLPSFSRKRVALDQACADWHAPP